MSEHNARENEGGSAVAFDFENGSLADFTKRMEDDRGFRQEYLDNPFDHKYDRMNELFQRKQQGEDVGAAAAAPTATAAPGGTPADPNAQPAPAAPAAPSAAATPASPAPEIEEFEVKIKVPKALLVNDRNNYLKDRTPEDAVIEALKGKGEADRFIMDLNSRLGESSKQTMELRRQLAEAKAAPAAGSAETPPGFFKMPEGVEKVEFDGDIDDIDLFVEDTHEKVRKALKAFQAITKAQPAPAATATPPAKTDSAHGGQQPGSVKLSPEEVGKLTLQKEMDEILALQAAIPELRTPVSFDKLDLSVFGFLTEVGKAIGIKNPESPEGQKAASEYYFSTAEDGQRVRDLCATKKITMPPGTEIHREIMAIRAERNNNRNAARLSLAKASGKDFTDLDVPDDLPGVTYADVFSRRGKQPSLTEFMRQAQVKSHKDAEAAAEAARSGHAKTVPGDMTQQPPMDVGGLAWNEFVSLVNLPENQLSPEKARVIVDAARKFGVSDDVPKYIIKKSQE